MILVLSKKQVQFDSWQEAKMCSMIINDDSVYEGPESFYVELSSPNYALLGDIGTALVTIIDVEDGKLCLLKMLNVFSSNDLSNNSLKANDYYVCLFGEADS